MKAKYFFRIILAIVVIVIGITIFNFFNHRNKGQLIIRVAPSDSTIQINDKGAKTGRHYLSPGTYKIQASKSGFVPDIQIVKVQVDKPTSAYLLPKPDSAEAENYLKNNPKEQSQREAIGGENFNNDQAKLQANYPILSKLPLELRYVAISYGQSAKYPKDATKIAILVASSTPLGREQGLNWIRGQGYDPTDYEILFQGFSNPFVKAGE